MKKIVVLLLVVFVKASYGQNWVEQRTYVSADGTATPRIAGLLTRPVKGMVGSFVWFQVQKGYSQAYAGPTLSPKPWIQLAVGAGLEEDNHPARVGSYVWVGNKQNSVLFIAEDGGSGFWHKTEALHTFNRFLDAGFIEERYKGSGVELRLKIPRTPIAIWAAPMVDRDPKTRQLRINSLFGIRWDL